MSFEVLMIILVFLSWIYFCKDVTGKALARFELHLLIAEREMGRC